MQLTLKGGDSHIEYKESFGSNITDRIEKWEELGGEGGRVEEEVGLTEGKVRSLFQNSISLRFSRKEEFQLLKVFKKLYHPQVKTEVF